MINLRCPPTRIFRALAYAASLIPVLVIASVYTLSATETQAQTAPSAPQTLTATAACTAGQVDLTWTAPATGTASKYQTRQKATAASWPASGGWTDTVPATATSATVTTATDGSTYDIEVRAVDTSASTPVNGTAATTTATASRVSCPIAVQALGGSAVNSILVTWYTPDSAGLTRTRFEYQYKLTSAGSYPTSGAGSWATVTGGATATFVDIASLPNQSHDFQIRAVADDSGTDVYSNIVSSSQTPSVLNPVTSLSATPGDQPGRIDITWTNPTTLNGDKSIFWRAGYHMTWRTADGAEFIEGSSRRGRLSFAGEAQRHQATITVDPGHEYIVAVVGTSISGSSGYVSTVVTARPIPIPAQPQLIPSTTSYGEATATWEYPQPASIALDSFQYQTRSQGETTWPASWIDATAPAVDPNVPGTTWTSNTISGGISEPTDVQIRSAMALSRLYEGSSSTHYSEPIIVSGNLGGPAPPEDLAVFPGEDVAEIDITWSHPSIPPPTPAVASGYRLRYKATTAEEYGDWITLAATATSHTAQTDEENIEYVVQVQSIVDLDGDLVATTEDIAHSPSAEANGFSKALETLPPPEGFKATMGIDSATLTWNEPTSNLVEGFRLRWRRSLDPDSTTHWSDWRAIPVVNEDEDDPNETQSSIVRHLQLETRYTFQIQSTAGGAVSIPVTISASTRIALARINRIEPVIRTITIETSNTVRLAVNVYDRQDGIANTKSDNMLGFFTGITTIFPWQELNGNGTFQTPNDARVVFYTAPDQPGTYSVTTQAMPDGICVGHHENPPNYDDCTATITVHVVTPPDIDDPTDAPQNPTGVIPASIDGGDGNPCAVFTPENGGTSRAIDDSRITVNAPPGAVPDNTIVAVCTQRVAAPNNTTASQSTHRVVFAEPFASITALNAQGTALQPYSFDEPIQACVPFPQQFRNRIDTVSMVVLPQDDTNDLAVLTSKAFTDQTDGLRLCAALSKLPATIAPARFGVQPTPTPHPGHSIGNIETGGTAPHPNWIIASTILFLLISIIITLRLTTCRIQPSR